MKRAIPILFVFVCLPLVVRANGPADKKTTYTFTYEDDTNCLPNPPSSSTAPCGSIQRTTLTDTVTYTYSGNEYTDVGRQNNTTDPSFTQHGVGPYDQEMSVSITLVLPFELPKNFSGAVIPVHSVFSDGIQTVTDPVSGPGMPGIVGPFVYPGPSMASCGGHFAFYRDSLLIPAPSVHNSDQPGVPYNAFQPPCLGAYFVTDDKGRITAWSIGTSIRYREDDVFVGSILSVNCQNDPRCGSAVVDSGRFSPQPYGGPFYHDRIFGQVVGEPGKWKVRKH